MDENVQLLGAPQEEEEKSTEFIDLSLDEKLLFIAEGLIELHKKINEMMMKQENRVKIADPGAIAGRRPQY